MLITTEDIDELSMEDWATVAAWISDAFQ